MARPRRVGSGAGLCAAAALLAACVSAPRQVALQRPLPPGRLAVLPLDNQTTSLLGPERVRRKLGPKLRALGYDVVGAARTDEALWELGVSDGGQLRAYAPRELGRALGVSSLFYGELTEFAVQNVGFILRRAVSVRLRCVGAESGETLWEAQGAGVSGRLALKLEEAGRIFVEGLAEQALEAGRGLPLERETEEALEDALRSFPRFEGRREP